MNKELQIILAKYFTIVALTIIYIVFMITFVGPAINQIAFGQTSTAVPVTGLRQVPQDYYTVVLPPAGVQQQSSFQGFGMENVMTAVSTFLTSIGLSKYLDNKDKKEVKQEINQTKEIVRDNTQTTAKLADAQLQTNQQVFQNMEDKGASITDKPAIKVDNLQKIKDKAVDTASKA